MSFQTIEWRRDRLILLDQTALPGEEVYREYTDHRSVARAIVDMVVRGAPAIGVTAAFGVALAAVTAQGRNPAEFRAQVEGAFEELAATRPTAVNLFWAIERMRRKFASLVAEPAPAAARELLREAEAICAEDIEANRQMGRHGAALLPDRCTVLTHCNAGALATAGYGTALGVVRAAAESGKVISVIADETRPFLQGSRLTAWELQRDGIPVTVIADGMAGARLRQGGVDAVIVGADRIASNGDVANKIGTYGVAVLAKENGVPFYVAAPLSTIDYTLESGSEIPIEERDPAEVTCCGGRRVAPEGVPVWNPAFDVTPSKYVTAIITERGVARPPYRESLENQNPQEDRPAG